MSSFRKRAICASVAASVFAALMIVGSFLDLRISKALYNPDSFFAVFFAKTGEIPLYLALPLTGTVVFFNTAKNRSFFRILSALLVFVGWFYFFEEFFGSGFLKLDYAEIYEAFFSLLLTALSLLAGYGVPRETIKRLLPVVLYAGAALIIAEFLIAAGKGLWARQRFYTMVEGSPYAPENAAELSPDFFGYTPWYRINAICPPMGRTAKYIGAFLSADSGAFRSFPSGHSAAAAASFAAGMLPIAFPKMKYPSLCYIIPALWTIMVGMSRIAAGAHYLTDVAAGAGIMIFTLWIMGYFLRKRLSRTLERTCVSCQVIVKGF